MSMLDHRWSSRLLAGFAWASAGLGLASWALGLPRLSSFAEGLPAQSVNTSLGLLGGGLALLLLERPGGRP